MLLKLRLVTYLVRVAIGGGMLEVGTSSIRYAGGMSWKLLDCLHCVDFIVRILKWWLLARMMWISTLAHYTNIWEILTLAQI